MTFIESLTILIGLSYIISLLFWSGKRWGAGIAAATLIAAMIIANSMVMFTAAAIAIPILALLNYRYKQRPFNAKINTCRSVCQHLLCLSLFIVAVQYCINTIMMKMALTPIVTRPDVVDAFLPIAGGISLRAIVEQGYFDPHHPAAAVMLGVVLLSGLLCKRAFCGWACPLGLLGEYLYKLRTRFIRKEYRPPNWLDWPLRAIKYLLLFALLYIVLGMPTQGLVGYLQSPYNKIADIKMAMLFVAPGLITLIGFAIILMLAAWRKQGFCRYICPYGALLGLLSFFSPLKIRRDCSHCLIEEKGMKCDKCTRACPAGIIVHTKTTVRSDECQACLRCIAACPSKAALGLRLKNGYQLNPQGLIALLLILLLALPLISYLFGFWDSQTPWQMREYLLHNIHRIGM